MFTTFYLFPECNKITEIAKNNKMTRITKNYAALIQKTTRITSKTNKKQIYEYILRCSHLKNGIKSKENTNKNEHVMYLKGRHKMYMGMCQ